MADIIDIAPVKRDAVEADIVSSEDGPEAKKLRRQVIVQFRDPNGVAHGPEVDISLDTTKEQLGDLLNKLLENNEDEPLPYSFEVGDDDSKEQITVTGTLDEAFTKSASTFTGEHTMFVTYYPMEVFRVKPITRCASAMEGHKEAVLCSRFSPDCNSLVTGGGDCMVRLWDLRTEAPIKEMKGHAHHVLAVEWSPDGELIASCGMDKSVMVWSGQKGEMVSKLKGHADAVTGLCWQPLHCVEAPLKRSLLASCSKDGTVKLWDVSSGVCVGTLAGHTAPVMQVRWSGEGHERGGYIYTAGRDRMVKVWGKNATSNGQYTMLKNMKGHAHWVNSLTLNTDYALRTGHFDPSRPYDAELKLKGGDTSLEGGKNLTFKDKQRLALEKYQKTLKKSGGVERMLSGSDDFTLILWEPALGNEKPKQVARMTGHQQIIVSANFSPDGRWIASGSFDKAIRLWDGRTGKYAGVLRGHVGPIYQLAWSADSRLLLSGSKDSTLKVWDVATKKLKNDLPGHADEIYSVDWAHNGSKACSAAKDRLVRIWRF